MGIKLNKNNHDSVSHGFKITMVVLLFTLTAARLIFKFYFPTIEIISDKVLLAVTLFIVVYLWAKEIKDYHRLLGLHNDLQESDEHLKQAEIDTIAALIEAEEEKDEYTRGHSERMTKIALAISEEMNLNDEKRQIIERAGILHDIGKIGISDAILQKKEKLTDEDWAVIKSHPYLADKILEPLKFLVSERDVILSHHERYDGNGYPRGLKDGDIRIEALILSVADAFDAMNSSRAYRPALSKEVIISELEKSRGKQHSAEVIDAALRTFKKKPELWGK